MIRQRPSQISQFVQLLILVPLVDLALRVTSLESTLATMEKLRTKHRRELHPRAIDDLRTAYVRVSRVYFRRVMCLQRSLAVFALAARRGLPLELIIGVRKYPFASHAWLESAGTPLFTEDPDLDEFQPVYQLNARR